ncbi:LacI family DNA-binding transcriptional regulator [Clostridium estertheticum]|uniref:Transcriptional regulator n=1 Tax=Clostridium estertheticum subsp. estertheticum TaxID=1552 RepID=A0A1J0GEF0_9CLOT|nr:LacI family DNA-binding transcriptional regulator [Clostridium estertheticum]APC39745.1 transcriptional regulator [Clostridium estertheticum subsp. estertheticum]MBU3172096.1 LacI family DNA-binding transcriptional regulator [Clostridium estertheticum]MBZ9614211.1 LacI family DNA-binding transcriptional regulator [Clostridium estertheticum subsp. laramiense]WAG74156.1 LacI family DNA-binding transcriptional regulator [Clostridium estertheticum]
MAKKVTMQDVANKVGVSKVTVSKALRGNRDISESMKEKIRHAAVETGYVFNSKGNLTMNDDPKCIGIISAERYYGQEDYFYIDLYRLLSSYLEKIHYTCMFHILTFNNEKNGIIPIMVEDKTVDGVIILGQLSKEYVKKIVKQNIPLVFLDFYYDKVDVDSINTDNFFGTYEITNMLIEKGHTKIAFVGNLNLTSSIQDRFLGYYKSILEYRLQFKDSWIINDRTDDSMWLDIILPDDMPTAFVCNCDKTALILIQKLEKCGYKIPEDYSVVGFDDSIHAMQSNPTISTVRVDLDEMARVAIKMISKKINDVKTQYGRVMIKGNLIIRDSTKK